jgi:hypothetical protein
MIVLAKLIEGGMMTISEIERKLDEMFPTAGMEEDVSMDDAEVQELIFAMHSRWDTFPEALQTKIVTIERNMCKRKPFALHILQFLGDGDVEEFFPDDWQ